MMIPVFLWSDIMIKLSGQLTVKTINGRNGPFNVGRLMTDIGEFAAKSVRIEELAEGKYSGTFLIHRIYPGSYCVGGRVIAEIRADLGDMFLSDHDEHLPPAISQELDPLNEELPKAQASAESVKPKPTPRAATSTAPVQADHAEPVKSTDQADPTATALFGSLWPLGSTVALDPTVDRSRLREQAAYLKQQGYRFDFMNKVWELSEL